MKILRLDRIVEFSIKHAGIKRALDTFVAVVKRADWRTPRHIKERFPSVDFLSENRVIFNIKGNHCRLLVKMDYEHATAAILWIGTHAQYDKLNLR